MDILVNANPVCEKNRKKSEIKSYLEIAQEFGCSDESIARTTKNAMAKAKRILERNGYCSEDFFGHEYFTNLTLDKKNET